MTKEFWTLQEFAKHVKSDVAQLLHQARLGKLYLSLPFYGQKPTKILTSEPHSWEGTFEGGDSGIFDLHLQDVHALSIYGEIMIESLFSKCGQWSVLLKPPRVVKLSDIVVRADEVAAFKWEASFAEQLSESERSRLLRQIGVMAMLIASQSKLYTNGTKPNATQISKAVDQILKDYPDMNSYGLGDTNIRTDISKGIELLVTFK